MRLAAIPVGASNITFGLLGSSPGDLRIFSTCLATTRIRKLFPTPEPPEKYLKNKS